MLTNTIKPVCFHKHTRIIDYGVASRGFRRRRECVACGYRFTTYEIRGDLDLSKILSATNVLHKNLSALAELGKLYLEDKKCKNCMHMGY